MKVKLNFQNLRFLVGKEFVIVLVKGTGTQNLILVVRTVMHCCNRAPVGLVFTRKIIQIDRFHYLAFDIIQYEN